MLVIEDDMDLRRIILKTLESQNRTKYWLGVRVSRRLVEVQETPEELSARKQRMEQQAKALDKKGRTDDARALRARAKDLTGKRMVPVANKETVFRYLRGERDTSGEVVATMIELLGIKLVPPETTPKDPLPTIPKQRNEDAYSV